MKHGKLTVVTGPMGAGKTETLIAAVREHNPEECRVVKPTVDTRFDDSLVHSHSGWSVEAEWCLPDLSNIRPRPFIFIDEAQFLDFESVAKVKSLLAEGYHVFLAGLDLDYRAIPFGPIPTFLALADHVIKIRGACACGNRSTRTKRLVAKDLKVLVGGMESYQPVCADCFLV